MPLLTVVITLLVVGVLMALLNKYGPPYIDAWYIQLVNVIVAVCVVLWLLQILGVWGYLGNVMLPTLRGGTRG